MCNFIQNGDEDVVSKTYGTLQKELARGVYGTVFSTTHGYAVKCMQKDLKENIRIDFIREITILKALRHPHIVNLELITSDETTHYLYMKLADGTMHEYINKVLKGRNRCSREPKWFIYQLLKALEYCHRHGVMHRDIKPCNVLLYGNKVQLADFGLSRVLVKGGETYTGDVVSLFWKAPELLRQKENYDYGVDIWPVGIMLATLLKEEMVITGETCYELLASINRYWKWLDDCCGSIDDDAVDLIKKLNAKQRHRISALDASEHHYFDDIRKKVDTKYQIYLPEQTFTYRPKYTNFNQEHRQELMMWLWAVTIDLKYQYNTVFLAYNIFDRFLERRGGNIKKADIQGYGICCLAIAEKLYERDVHSISIYIDLCLNAYKKRHLQKFEYEILEALEFNILNTPYSYYIDKSDANYKRKIVCLLAVYLNYNWVTGWDHMRILSTINEYIAGEENYYTVFLDNYLKTLEDDMFKRVLRQN